MLTASFLIINIIRDILD